MSGENVEVARRAYELFNRGEMDRFLTEFVHPDCEFHLGVQVPSFPSVVRGRDGLRAWTRQFYEEPWEGRLQMDVERAEELDDGRVLALLVLRGEGRGSGVPVEGEYAHILTLREGQCLRIDGFGSWNQALKEAGLSR